MPTEFKSQNISNTIDLFFLIIFRLQCWWRKILRSTKASWSSSCRSSAASLRPWTQHTRNYQLPYEDMDSLQLYVYCLVCFNRSQKLQYLRNHLCTCTNIKSYLVSCVINWTILNVRFQFLLLLMYKVDVLIYHRCISKYLFLFCFSL